MDSFARGIFTAGCAAAAAVQIDGKGIGVKHFKGEFHAGPCAVPCAVAAGNGQRFSIGSHAKPGFRLDGKGSRTIWGKGGGIIRKALSRCNNVVRAGRQINGYALLARIRNRYFLRVRCGCVALRFAAEVQRFGACRNGIGRLHIAAVITGGVGVIGVDVGGFVNLCAAVFALFPVVTIVVLQICSQRVAQSFSAGKGIIRIFCAAGAGVVIGRGLRTGGRRSKIFAVCIFLRKAVRFKDRFHGYILGGHGEFVISADGNGIRCNLPLLEMVACAGGGGQGDFRIRRGSGVICGRGAAVRRVNIYRKGECVRRNLYCQYITHIISRVFDNDMDILAG